MTNKIILKIFILLSASFSPIVDEEMVVLDCFSDYSECSLDAEYATLATLEIIEQSPETERRTIERYISMIRKCANNYYSCN